MPSTDPNAPSPSGPTTRREARGALATSDGWTGPFVALGVVTVVLGVLVLVWPQATLLVVAIIFGLQLIVVGAVRLAMSRTLPSEPGWLRPVSIGLGALTIVFGIVCLFRPNASLVVIAIVIAAGWIAEGFAALAQGFSSDRTTGSRIFLIVLGIIVVLAGFAIAIFPRESLVLLTRLGGIMLIVIGAAELVAAFLARRAAASGAIAA
jgi:uncharacterized membrane protein HdeD (DUF308 family)